METAWKQQILQLLRERNQRETGSFKDLILSRKHPFRGVV